MFHDFADVAFDPRGPWDGVLGQPPWRVETNRMLSCG